MVSTIPLVYRLLLLLVASSDPTPFPHLHLPNPLRAVDHHMSSNALFTDFMASTVGGLEEENYKVV